MCASGCTCSENTYFHGGKCVTADQCPSKQVLSFKVKANLNTNL